MTRQDAMVFLKRTIDRTALKLGTGSVSSFSDASRISNYAKPSVSALVGAKVIGGSKGKINPLSKVTRAEMAVMLYRATHLTVQGSGAVYQSRGDLVNLCIGTQNYCDVVIDETEDVQVEVLDRAFYFDDIFFAHLVAAGVFDYGDAAVQLIQLQIVVNGHAFAGFDMIQNKSFFNTSDS